MLTFCVYKKPKYVCTYVFFTKAEFISRTHNTRNIKNINMHVHKNMTNTQRRPAAMECIIKSSSSQKYIKVLNMFM